MRKPPETTVRSIPSGMTGQTAMNRALDYLVVFGLLCLSGNPVFSVAAFREVFLLGGALALTGLLVYRGVSLTRGFALTSMYFTALLLAQCISFQFYPFSTIIGFLVRLYVAYLAVRVVVDFPRAYVNVIYYLAVIALGFWALENAMGLAGMRLSGFFGPVPYMLGGERHLHILVFNFRQGLDTFPLRNAGMFWEPGALAGYTVLGLIFLGLRRDSFSKKQYWLRLGVLLLCILTTRSTMGYLVAVPALALHLKGVAPARRAVPGLPASLALLLLIPISLAVWNADFVARKMNVQLERAMTRGPGWQINRIGSFLFDMEYIRRRPAMGWGVHRDTRYMLHRGTTVYLGQGNGLSDFTAKFGLLGLAGFCFTSWIGLSSVGGGRPLIGALALVLVLLALNGETFLNHPAYLSLMFLADARSRAAVRAALPPRRPAMARGPASGRVLGFG